MDLACAFARLVLVGRVLYNRILGKESAEELWRMIKPNIHDYIDVDLSAVFERSDLKLARQGETYRFLCNFQNKLRRHQWDAAKKAICKREIDIKGRARAKLLHPDGRKTQERDWIGGLWLDYRLSSAREIVEGIRQSMKEGRDA